MIELLIVEVLIKPYDEHPQVDNSVTICDVIVENSLLIMYREFHFFFQIFVKNNISIGVLFV